MLYQEAWCETVQRRPVKISRRRCAPGHRAVIVGRSGYRIRPWTITNESCAFKCGLILIFHFGIMFGKHKAVPFVVQHPEKTGVASNAVAVPVGCPPARKSHASIKCSCEKALGAERNL